jgi:hypothetical protein
MHGTEPYKQGIMARRNGESDRREKTLSRDLNDLLDLGHKILEVEGL